ASAGPCADSAGDRALHGRLLGRLQGAGRLVSEARRGRVARLPPGLGRAPDAGGRIAREGRAMNASEALGRLKRLRVPAATTADAAAVLRLSGSATTHMLRRLARAGLIAAFRKGVWALAEQPDRLVLADYVTAPYPAYVSLQTALYQHGMIEQIPSMTYL